MSIRRMMLLCSGYDNSVEDEELGDGIRICRLSADVKNEIFRQQKEVLSSSHYSDEARHTISKEFESANFDDSEAIQEIYRALLTLRLVKCLPTSTYLWVQATKLSTKWNYHVDSPIGFGSQAYAIESDCEVVSPLDLAKARVLWPRIQKVFQNWNENLRLVRTLRMYEMAHWTNWTEIRYILFFSVLERLLGTSQEYLTQQLKQRVDQMCPDQVGGKIGDFSRIRGGYVHSGKIPEEFWPTELEESRRLENVVRACLLYVVSDQERIEIFKDDEEIRAFLPVTVQESIRTQTGKKISV